MSQSTSPKSGSLAFLLYIITGLALWALYLAFTTIAMHYYRDFYNIKSYDWLRNYLQYAHGTALLIMGVIALTGNRFFLKKAFDNQTVTLDMSSRLWVMRLIILFAGISAFWDIYSLLTQFLLGKGAEDDVIRGLITLTTAGGIIFYAMHELSRTSVSNFKVFSPRYGVFLAISALFLGIAVYKEPLNKMKLINEDLELLRQMSVKVNQIQDYRFRNKQLPVILDALGDNEPLYPVYGQQPGKPKPMTYRPMTGKIFEICGTFNLDRKELGRHDSHVLSNFDFKQGHSCHKVNLN